MARDFIPTGSQYLQYGGAVASATPFTLACWVNPDVVGSYGLINIALDTDPAAFTGWILWLKNVSSTLRAAVALQQASTYGEAVTTATLTTGTWAHVCGVFASNTSRTIYLNGGNNVSESTGITPSGVNKTTIGAYYYNGAIGTFLDGKLAEVGIWDVALTVNEISSLAKGYSPLFVRPENLITYVPLIRDNDKDIVGGVTFTANGSPGVSRHSRVLYIPRVQYITTQASEPPEPPGPGGISIRKQQHLLKLKQPFI